MSIDEGGAALYFCLSFGAGYAVGSFNRLGFLDTWLLSLFFVPIAYELLHANWLMVETVIGFSFGLFIAKIQHFYDLVDYLKSLRQSYRNSQRKDLARKLAPAASAHQESSSPFDLRTAEEILGLPISYTPEELKIAFQRESQRTHPDRWLHKPPHIRKMMETEQKRINWAYQQLLKRR